MRADSYLKKAVAGHYGPQARQDAQSVVEQAAASGYAHDAERIVRELGPDPRRAAAPTGQGPTAVPAGAPAIDVDWLSELLELSDSQPWRDEACDAQARFVTEMLPRRGDALDIDYRVTLSVGVARWAALHGHLDAATATEDFRERLSPAVIADGLNQLDEVQLDGVGFNVEDLRAAAATVPAGDLDASARALFEACEIGFERWADLTADCQQMMRERARRVVDAFHGRTRTAGTPGDGYYTGSSCRACGRSFDQCTSSREEWAEWAVRREQHDLAAATAPPRSCCSACDNGTLRALHEVVLVEPDEREGRD